MPKRQKPPKRSAPPIAAKARKLRNRWLEQISSGSYVLEARGRYDVSRQLEAPPSPLKPTPLLKAA